MIKIKKKLKNYNLNKMKFRKKPRTPLEKLNMRKSVLKKISLKKIKKVSKVMNGLKIKISYKISM